MRTAPYRMASIEERFFGIVEAAIIRAIAPEATQTDAEIAISLMRCYKALIKRDYRTLEERRQAKFLADIRAMRAELEDEKVRLDRIAEGINNLSRW